jgi:hypothetical protein
LLAVAGIVFGCFTGVEGRDVPCGPRGICAVGVCVDGYCVPGDETGIGGDDGGDSGLDDGGADDGEEDDGGGDDGGSSSGGSSSGGTDMPGDDGGTEPPDDGGTDMPGDDGGTDNPPDDDGTAGDGGATSGGATTTEPACDPNDPDQAVDPVPEEQPGDECCTTKQGCSGKEVGMETPTLDDLGHLMECIDGVWVIDDSDCIGECPAGTSYEGCFWHGPTRNCGCQ